MIGGYRYKFEQKDVVCLDPESLYHVGLPAYQKTSPPATAQHSFSSFNALVLSSRLCLDLTAGMIA